MFSGSKFATASGDDNEIRSDSIWDSVIVFVILIMMTKVVLVTVVEDL